MASKWLVVGAILLALASTACYASGDYGCGAARGSLFFRGYDACDSVPFLSPGNDSRLNLELLLIDAGKLKGSLSLPQNTENYPWLQDLAQLQVPFDFGNWQVLEPGAAAPAGNGSDAANASDYAQGEGSRCNSSSDGAAGFTTAVNAAGLPAGEAAILIAARGGLTADCNATAHAAWNAPQGIKSAMGREFLTYVAGADAFYGGDFAAAANDFKGLTNSKNAWLKETSRYMVARTWLNSAPTGAFGEWGALDLDKVDKGNLKSAEDAFDAYLRDYPRGVYAVSARGLLRRVYWLGGDRTRLAEAFDGAFLDADKGGNNVTVEELVEEADAKLLDSVTADQIQSPQFLAILDLMRMRSADLTAPGATSRSTFALADLEAQKERFASNPALFNYLVAVYHVYIDDQPEQALALLPKPTNAALNYFAFSQQSVRMMALEATKQYDQERKLIAQMLPLAKMPLEAEELQLALARVEVITGHADQVFAAASPIEDKAIRTIVVEYTASAELLRQRVKDPKENADVVNAALYTLLYKELTGGKYQAFQTDVALEPAKPTEFLAPFAAGDAGKGAEYPCPALRQVAATLQHDGNDAKSLNCVGELVRLHGVHYGQDNPPPATDLGGADSMFAVTNYSRMDGYLKVIANVKAESDARAYALYRAVNCYAPSGNNDCGNQNIAASTRKAWFQMLHKEYGDSVWAKSSKYYW